MTVLSESSTPFQMLLLSPQETQGLRLALEKATQWRGATAPNPPVGAVALDRHGRVLAAEAHQRAGTLHAEAHLFRFCAEQGTLDQIDTVLVTLEPCSHTGRTPPCADALIRNRVRRCVAAVKDPNPKVNGKGLERLRRAGIEAFFLEDFPEAAPELLGECRALLAPFTKHQRTGLPWVTVKTALDEAGSMIPPKGQRTFTSESSLTLAHELRRRADAILTGSGTILADQPEFTIRRVADHPSRSRWLVVLDRRGRTPQPWIEQASERGFQIRIDSGSFQEALEFLGTQGVLEVLVEAGPTLSASVLSGRFWDEHVVITRGADGDRIEVRRRGSGCSQES